MTFILKMYFIATVGTIMNSLNIHRCGGASSIYFGMFPASIIPHFFNTLHTCIQEAVLLCSYLFPFLFIFRFNVVILAEVVNDGVTSNSFVGNVIRHFIRISFDMMEDDPQVRHKNNAQNYDFSFQPPISIKWSPIFFISVFIAGWGLDTFQPLLVFT